MRHLKLLAMLLPLLWILSCTGGDEKMPERPNVLLIGMDTVRADHLGCYGYERETSPVIDQLAAEGVQFMTCISHIPVTAPSFSTIFTSKLPFSHGVLDNNWILDDEHVTLTEVLKKHGYKTAGFVSGLTIKQNMNLDQGFDVYSDDFDVERIAEVVNKPAMQWLEENQDDQFFMFLHYFNPHGVYQPPHPYDTKFEHTKEEHDLSKIPEWQRHGSISDPSYYVAQYDGEIRYNDYHLGEFLKKLEELGLKDNTLIIFTSDHGETMNEHYYWFDHGCYVYEEQVHVPLIIRWPEKFTPKKIKSTARLIDIMPTIMDILGIEPIDAMEGTTLLPKIEKDTPAAVDIYLESARGEPNRNENIIEGTRGKLLAIRTDDWKLIRTPKTSGVEYELYNLKEDPEELQNLIGSEPEIENHLRKKLDSYEQKYYNALPWFLKKGKKVEVDEEEIKKLRSFGYF